MMYPVAVGFWGGYFGVAFVACAASAIPLAQRLPRVALLMAAGPLLNAAYVIAALGWWPASESVNLRVQSMMALHNSLALSALMLLMLRTRGWVWRGWFIMAGFVALLAVAVWMLPPREGMLLATGWATVCTFVALALLFHPRALRHHRLAWLAVCSVASVSLGLMLTAWIAYASAAVAWQAHAFTAAVVTVHEICMAYAVWSQFSHLAELQLVRAYGAGYDPVTRLRSVETAGNLINTVFSRSAGRNVGAIAVTVANIFALESMHGRAEQNQALFILATRLRNTLPRGVQMCRLGPDVFLLLVRHAHAETRLLELAGRLRERLIQPITLGTAERPSELHVGGHKWTPEIGLGVLVVPPGQNRAAAINAARGLSRAGLRFPGRIARLSPRDGEAVAAELVPRSPR